MSLHFVFHQAAIFLINNNYWARYENTRGSYKCICQGFEGNAAEKTVGCVRKPVSCKAQPDCPPNTFCYGGICKPVCENSNRCTEGRCIPLCTIDSQCVFNKKCVFSNCMLTCRVDNDCFSVTFASTTCAPSAVSRTQTAPPTNLASTAASKIPVCLR